MHKRKIKITGGLWDAYKKYKTDYNSKISRKQYVDICHDFNKEVSQMIIKKSFEFKLPYRLGSIRIKCFKLEPKIVDGKILVKHLAPDWKSSMDLWRRQYPNKTKNEIKNIPNKKIIYHLNEHTDGLTMKWYWDRRFHSFKNKSAYLFKPIKGGITSDGYWSGRKGLAEWIQNPLRKNDYYE